MEFIEMNMSRLKKLFIFLLFIVSSVAAYAQNGITFEANVPAIVPVGKVFRLEYTITAKPDKLIYEVSGLDMDGIDIVAGPTNSYGSQMFANGATVVRQESYTNTYVLMANKPGIYNIPAAKVTVDGKEYATKTIPFEAVEEQGNTQQQQQAGSGGQQQANSGSARPSVGDDALFLRAVVDKSSAYKGQPIRLYFKLYSQVRIAGTESMKMPAFNGFWAQELSSDHYSWQQETYRSKVYNSRIIKEYLLYPQQGGEIKIEPLEMTIVTQRIVPRVSQSMFDDFFGGGQDIVQESKKVATSPINIKVLDFPAGAPSGFNGAVGNFTMTADFPEGTINANSSVNYTLRITGNGNFSLIQTPSLDVPGTFEQYNVKTTESLNKATSGISGYRQFEFPLIARAEGEYTIDPVRFVYFNPETAKYSVLQTKEYNVKVLPDSTGGGIAGNGSIVTGVSKEDIKLLGEDIRFIKLGTKGIRLKGSILMGSTGYFITLFFIIALFVSALIYLQKKIKELRNVELVRGKRANKVALQRLKAAEGYMKEGSQRNFYEEMLKALWGYMSDKLNIPSAILTKENVREELFKRNIPQEDVARYTDLISDCEYAQYSPSGSGHMHEIYANAVKSISKFESLIKR